MGKLKVLRGKTFARKQGPGVCLGDGQTEAYLKDMGMAGLASVLVMARRRPV